MKVCVQTSVGIKSYMKWGYYSCRKYTTHPSLSPLHQLELIITYTVSNLLNQDLTHTLNFQDFIWSNY